MKWKLVIAVLLIGLMVACDESGDNPGENQSSALSNYFSIEGAELVSAKLPEASVSTTAPVIQSVSGNNSVINGGTNRISIESNSEYSKVIVGVKELTSGYYEFTPELKSTYVAAFVLQMSTELPQESFILVFAIVNATGEVSQYREINVALVESQVGALQVSCSWDLLNDIDLHVVNPEGVEVYYGNTGYDYGFDYVGLVNHYLGLNFEAGTSYDDIYDSLTEAQIDELDNLTASQLNQFRLDSTPGGNLDVDSNANCNIDHINNENIIYPTKADMVAGEYIVRVDFYSDCVGSGQTNYTVLARYNGALIQPSSSTNPYDGIFNAGEQDRGGSGSGVEVMRFTITDDQLKSASTEKICVFEFNNKSNIATKTINRINKMKNR